MPSVEPVIRIVFSIVWFVLISGARVDLAEKQDYIVQSLFQDRKESPARQEARSWKGPQVELNPGRSPQK
jgi:hypothetical protein